MLLQSTSLKILGPVSQELPRQYPYYPNILPFLSGLQPLLPFPAPVPAVRPCPGCPEGAADASAQRGVHQRSDHLHGRRTAVAAIHAASAADELLAAFGEGNGG